MSPGGILLQMGRSWLPPWPVCNELSSCSVLYPPSARGVAQPQLHSSYFQAKQQVCCDPTKPRFLEAALGSSKGVKEKLHEDPIPIHPVYIGTSLPQPCFCHCVALPSSWCPNLPMM